jgi:hypothetical protein
VSAVATKRNLRVVEVSHKADQSTLLASISTGLVILAFGAVWFSFLHGLTAAGRMLMFWHFLIFGGT